MSRDASCVVALPRRACVATCVVARVCLQHLQDPDGIAVWQESMRERDALAEEAAANILQLEAKIDSNRAEIKKLTAHLREAKDNFRSLEQSKTSAVSQLEARCDALPEA